MPKNGAQKEKLLRLYEYLLEETDAEHGVTVAQMAEHLAAEEIFAERKALYDDLLVLSSLGMTVERLHTRPERYYLKERPFTLSELKMLVDAVQASKFIPHEDSRTLIKKLEHYAGRYAARELSRQVCVENRAKTRNAEALEIVDRLHTAIREDRQITFAYYDYNSKKQKVFRHGGRRYLASPYAMLWNNENYYLIARDEDSAFVKHFRVDKMENIDVCKEKRTYDEKFSRLDPASYSEKAFGMYGGKEELVTLRCDNSLAGVVIDRFGMEPTLLPSDGTHFCVSLRVMISPNFYSFVLGFGRGMEILAPRWVREELIAQLHSLSAFYAEGENA